eukprot:NODE_458_length_1651_cov_241.399501_g350_i0.p1 GENE.NODE_458_length_1651_cov_241.399501_g350_i0~~NODE_458_length_1651_cov_241.399501_g350_i0.p1  ORF type:complete len:324 (-),score=79.68 NODE_458_length_1651_cov_241.399501_g350_i0:224-1195(-)
MIRVATSDAIDAVVSDETHQKVVLVAWLVAGDKNCDAVLAHLRTVARDAAFANSIFLLADPREMAEVARSLALCAVPAFQLYWKGERTATFEGSNEVKITGHLRKTLRVRDEAVLRAAQCGRDAVPEFPLGLGDELNFGESCPDIESVVFGMGWDVTDDTPEMMAAVLMLGESGKLVDRHYAIYEENTMDVSGSVEYLGDQFVSESKGDNESVACSITTLPPEVHDLVFAIYISDAEEGEKRDVHFGDITGVYLRAYARESHHTVFKFNAVYETESGILVTLGRFSRVDEDWVFFAECQAMDHNLQYLIQQVTEPKVPKKGKK